MNRKKRTANKTQNTSEAINSTTPDESTNFNEDELHRLTEAVGTEELTLRELSDGLHSLAEAAYEKPTNHITIKIFRRSDGQRVEVKATLDGRCINENPLMDDPYLRLYKFKWDGGGKNAVRRFAVFVLRGTHVKEDLKTDFELASLSNDVPSRFTQSENYVRQLLNSLKDTRVLFTGHSLGAAEAEYLAVLFRRESMVFENPGCGNIIRKCLKYRKIDKERHLTENGNPNLVNRAATWFTGGPVGDVIHVNDGKFVVLDMFLTLLMLVLLRLFSVNPGVNVTNILTAFVTVFVLYVICSFTIFHHSLGSRNRIAYYTENAPAGGHLILFVILMLLGACWLVYKGGKWVWYNFICKVKN